MYHGFTDEEENNSIENYQGKSINIELFRSQIKYLKNHYNVISLSDYVDFCKKGKKLPDKSIIITIDDGYKSNYTLAFPIFKDFDVPATIFLTTDFINNKNFFWVDRLEYAINNTKAKKLELTIGNEKLYFSLTSQQEKISCDKILRNKFKSIENLNPEELIQHVESLLNIKLSEASKPPPIYEPLGWNEIVEMIKSSKVDIGSHTHKHLLLAKYKKEIVLNELSLSKEIIESQTRIDTSLFCYPSGSFNDETKLFVKESGYSCALTTVKGMNNEISDLYELKRFSVENTDLKSFVLTISRIRYFLSQMRNNFNVTS